LQVETAVNHTTGIT